MVKYLDNNSNSGFRQWAASKTSADKPKSKISSFLWWFMIFLASWWLLGTWMAPKKTDVQTAPEVAVETLDLSSVPTLTVASDDISGTVQGLRISDIKLQGFTKNGTGADKDLPVSLLSGDDNFAEIGFIAGGTTAPVADTVWKTENGAYVWRNPDGVNFTRTITADGYLITVKDTIKNNSNQDITFAPYARISRTVSEKPAAGVYTGAIAFVNSDLEHIDWAKLDKKSSAYSTTNGFIGFADQYWETLVSVNSPDKTISMKKVDENYQNISTSAPVKIVKGGDTVIETNIFAGPRTAAALNIAESKIIGASKTMDYGWFWFFAQPMLWILNILNSIVMNYGVAIILLTLALRLLMWPLTRKSYTSMMAMQKMQPEMAKIQKLYANDKARLQIEMMKLYQTHKTSPMSGCLPMLVQIPIFFALYKALLISVPMRSASFLWISDLSVMDPYFILPVLMGATMFWQQRLQSPAKSATVNTNDPAAQTQKVMKWMPLIFTVMFAWMPAGLVLYWTVSNLFGIAQMYIIKKTSK